MAEAEGQGTVLSTQGHSEVPAGATEGQPAAAASVTPEGASGAEGKAASTEGVVESPVASWLDSLPEDVRSDDSFKDMKDSGELAKTFLDLKKSNAELSEKLPKVPENADGYTLEIPAGVTVDEGFVAEMKKAAFESGVGQAQFEGMAKNYIALQQAADSYRQTEMDAGVNALKIEWGAGYDAKVERARQAFRKFATSTDEVDHINNTGYGNDPVLIRMFERISAAVSDDTPPEGDGGVGEGESGGKKPMLDFSKSWPKK